MTLSVYSFDSVKSLGKLRPSRTAVGEWKILDFNRRIPIYEADPTDTQARNTYFHIPIFAFYELDKPINDYPKIVQKYVKLPNSSTRLHFKVALSSPPIRQLMRDILVNQYSKTDGEFDKVKVYKWPAIHMVINCYPQGGRKSEILSMMDTFTITNIGDDLEFTMDFIPDDLERFKELGNNGELWFVFAYSFEGREIAKMQVETTGSVSAKDLLRRHLTHAQKKKDEPIFQKQVNSIQREISLSFTRIVTSQDKDILPIKYETGQILNQLIQLNRVATMDDLNGDPELRKHVAKYLSPLIDTQDTSIAKKESITEIAERTKEKKRIRLNGSKMGLKNKIVSADLKTEKKTESTDTQKEKLENTYGITMTYDKKSQNYVLTTIDVYQIAEGWSDVTIDTKDIIAVATGENTKYLESVPIISTFTVQKILKNVKPVSEQHFYDGVPLGTILPFAGNRIPLGYVWLNPDLNKRDGLPQRWPKTEWVPVHLRGKPLPDMRRHLIGGSDDLNEVGKEWNKGNIQFTVDGKNFKPITNDSNRSTAGLKGWMWMKYGKAIRAPSKYYRYYNPLYMRNSPFSTPRNDFKPNKGWTGKNWNGLVGFIEIGSQCTGGDYETKPDCVPSGINYSIHPSTEATYKDKHSIKIEGKQNINIKLDKPELSPPYLQINYILRIK